MKNKSGFTMAELLLCVAIIGIVSAMGLTVAKRSTDSAYNLYYYTGYINLYNTIADIRADEDNNALNAQNVNLRLGTTDAPDEENWIIAANGIKYQVNGNTIVMSVPQRKTSANPDARANVSFRYEDVDTGYLIPLVVEDQVNLQNRRDLLPAYIDNGMVGRMRRENPDDETYKLDRIQYYTYQEAFCGIRNNTPIAGVIDCPADLVVPNANQARGTLKVADPRRAH